MPPTRPSAGPRIAVISTPRSGNSWLSLLLARAYEVPRVARHSMTEEDWAALPPEFVLQIHWPRTPEFGEQLRSHDVRVVTLARHPLDVLISILHFCWYEPDTAMWLLGRGGDESGLMAAMPRSRPFIEYATGPRAAALLSVTPDWWGRPDGISLTYEDLVRDTSAGLLRIGAALGPFRCESIDAAVAECSLDNLRKTSANNHFWKGQPNLYRQLLPAAEVAEIVTVIRPVLDALGYDCQPDTALDPATADRNWVTFAGTELAQTLHMRTGRHQK